MNKLQKALIMKKNSIDTNKNIIFHFLELDINEFIKNGIPNDNQDLNQETEIEYYKIKKKFYSLSDDIFGIAVNNLMIFDPLKSASAFSGFLFSNIMKASLWYMSIMSLINVLPLSSISFSRNGIDLLKSLTIFLIFF
jgi:hypothetical protein